LPINPPFATRARRLANLQSNMVVNRPQQSCNWWKSILKISNCENTKAKELDVDFIASPVPSLTALDPAAALQRYRVSREFFVLKIL